MRPQKLTFLLLIALLAFAMTGCEKNPFAPDTELPPETTSGANTFGCLVNGKVWRNGGYFFPSESLNIPEMSASRLQIAATRKVADTLSGIDIFIGDTDINEGNYLCDSLNIIISYILIVKGTAYDYTYAHEGEVEITRYDLENRIVSGRFNAKLKLDGNKEIVITNGRFDLKN